MKILASTAKVYVLSTILIGIGLIVWMVMRLDWTNLGLYLLAALGSFAQTLKVEGPDDRTNYSIAWFVYGLAFITLDPNSALFVIVIAHLVDWIWHKYPWYIQSFNIGAHTIPVFLAGIVFGIVSRRSQALDLNLALGLVIANLIFVVGNHFLVALVVKLARGLSFAESGVLGFFTLFLDFTVLSMGTVTAVIWLSNPFTAVLNILPLYLLYRALRVPALEHKLQKMTKMSKPMEAHTGGD